MSARARRLARGWAGAVIATSFAVASHTAAGGQVPAPMLVLLSLALSGPLCVALAGRVLSRSSLLAGVLLSQGVFHALFTASGSVTTVADGTHHAVAGAPATGPVLVLEAGEHTAHGGPAMLVLHVLAAVAGYALMRHGEVAAVALLDALRLRVRRVWQALFLPFVTEPPRAVPDGRPHVLTDQSLLRPVRSHRGPPRGRRRPLLPVLPTGPALLPAG